MIYFQDHSVSLSKKHFGEDLIWTAIIVPIMCSNYDFSEGVQVETCVPLKSEATGVTDFFQSS